MRRTLIVDKLELGTSPAYATPPDGASVLVLVPDQSRQREEIRAFYNWAAELAASANGVTPRDASVGGAREVRP